MRPVLALETSGRRCSVALTRDDRVIAQRAFRHEMRLLERLISEVDEVLRAGGTTLSEVAGIAVDVGPGSFTGLRIGIATAKTWAAALDLPVWGVSSLAALAWAHRSACDGMLLSAIPARPGHLFAAVYDLSLEGTTIERVAPGLYPLAGLQEEMPDGVAMACGPAAPDAVRAMGASSIPVLDEDEPDAIAVAAIAESRLRRGLVESAVSLTPLYLAEPHTTTPKRALFGPQ